MTCYLDVVLEDVCSASDGRHVVHDELAVGSQEVAALVQLLDTSLVLTVCNTLGYVRHVHTTAAILYTRNGLVSSLLYFIFTILNTNEACFIWNIFEKSVKVTRYI